MSKSQRLRLGEVRSIFRLVGECRELGADCPAWRRHAAECLRGLIGAQVAFVGELAGPPMPGIDAAIQIVDVGWGSPQARQIWVEYISSGAIQNDPFMLEFARLPGRFK